MRLHLTQEIENRAAEWGFVDINEFISDAKTYIKAVQSGRILYDVIHVSASGMSRDIKIRSFEGTMRKGYYRTYAFFLHVIGVTDKTYNNSVVRVQGCGMNMVFDLNYRIIHKLHSLGFINKAQCEKLAQKVN